MLHCTCTQYGIGLNRSEVHRSEEDQSGVLPVEGSCLDCLAENLYISYNFLGVSKLVPSSFPASIIYELSGNNFGQHLVLLGCAVVTKFVAQLIFNRFSKNEYRCLVYF